MAKLIVEVMNVKVPTLRWGFGAAVYVEAVVERNRLRSAHVFGSLRVHRKHKARSFSE